MAGLTEHGLEIKRLHEVISDSKAEAVRIFQDLVPPGDIVDTSDSTTIGRLIGLKSPAIADLWEAVQQVYLAFDPNSATGVALDNLVMYGGLTRNPASPTTATVVVWGDENTSIFNKGNVVRATDNTLYDIVTTVYLTRERNIGVTVEIPSVVAGEVYGLQITSASTTIGVSVTANGGDTADSILTSLQSQLSFHPFLITTLSTGSLTIETSDIYSYIGVVPSNVNLRKIKGRTEVRNQEVGPKEQSANTINQIATPMLGWDSVNNPFEAIIGRERETDAELRMRFRNSKFLRAQNIADALYSALLELDGVSYVAIYENESNVYDYVYNLPPHSFKPVVLGGLPSQIAQVIWNNKPLGISSEGNSSEMIFDSQGFEREIRFERPTNVPIYISLELTTNSNFPADGVDRIKSALVEYFQNIFSIGRDVIYSRLYTPINSVSGHQVDSLFIGTSPSPTGVSNIPIPYNGVASLSTGDIIITIS